jgi:PGDYG protein
VSPSGLLFLRASGRPGWQLDPSLGVALRARKRVAEVEVTFAQAPGRLRTLEGEVLVQPGDAIVQGQAGERWRVSAPHFDAKYVATDRPGRYRSRPYAVQALCLAQACELLLPDGQSTLQGQPGDWLLDYGDGSLGIVAAHLFELTYELL